MQDWKIKVMEKGFVPDFVIRQGIRSLCKDRLSSLRAPTLKAALDSEQSYAESLKKMPVAVETQAANEQHYELPPEFFELALGKHRKYSSAYWTDDCRSLDEAEKTALEVTIKRAEIKDGHQILELGCGWGSLTLEMARRFPNSKIVAISNSAPQRLSIEARAKAEGLDQITVLTRNIVNVTGLEHEFGPFDRVVSVEMFEHLKNYEEMFHRVSQWLKPQGKCFIHIFTHRAHSYPFETEGADNWMGKYFFTGGQMPSHELLTFFQRDLKLEQLWHWNGTHYGKTSEAWLKNMDRHKEKIFQIFKSTYGKDAAIWVQRWRVFFMACAELFNFKSGQEWGVSHYLFKKP